MSGTKDTNWISYCGPEYDGRIIGPDNWQAPAVPADYDDLFKCSDIKVFNVVDLDIPDGSQEDAIDCVRGENYTFSNCKVRGSVTVKGSINGWTLQDSLADGLLEFGQYDNYWYAGRPPTQHISIKNCTSSSGGKITIRLWDATYPFVANTRHRVQRDAFIPKKQYPSWILNEESCVYEAPVKNTASGDVQCLWIENEQRWDCSPIPKI